MLGKKFASLTVVREGDRDKHGHIRYECSCDCGGSGLFRKHSLTSGNSKSCGCLRSGVTRNKTHGGTGTRLYVIWTNMKQRCNNPNCASYGRYGGRGISICGEWSSYLKFEEWSKGSGYTEELTIDRIDNNGDYKPTNCQWLTRSENSKKKALDNK